MPRKTLDLVARAERLAGAWQRCHPEKVFFGLTLDAFIEALKPSREARTGLAALTSQRRVLLHRRRNSDNSFRPLLMGVVHAVRGDPDVGEDDAMYSSMGYVSMSRRRKPGRKKKKLSARPRG
jgi:hypothetical protein